MYSNTNNAMRHGAGNSEAVDFGSSHADARGVAQEGDQNRNVLPGFFVYPHRQYVNREAQVEAQREAMRVVGRAQFLAQQQNASRSPDPYNPEDVGRFEHEDRNHPHRHYWSVVAAQSIACGTGIAGLVPGTIIRAQRDEIHQRTMAKAHAWSTIERGPQMHAHPGPYTRAIHAPCRGNSARGNLSRSSSARGRSSRGNSARGRSSRGNPSRRSFRQRGRGGRGGASRGGNYHNFNPSINLLRVDAPSYPLSNPLRESLIDPHSLWAKQQLELQQAQSREVHRIKALCDWPQEKHQNPLHVSKDANLNWLDGIPNPHQDYRKFSQSNGALSATSSRELWSGAHQSSYTGPKKLHTQVTPVDNKRVIYHPKARRPGGLENELLYLVEKAGRDSKDCVPKCALYTSERKSIVNELKVSPAPSTNGEGPNGLSWVDGPGAADDDHVDNHGESSDHGHDGDGNRDANGARDDGDGSEYNSSGSHDEAPSDGSSSWDGFERALYSPAAAENHDNMRVRSAPPALESVRADRDHLLWPDRHYGINGWRVLLLADVDFTREGYGSRNPAVYFTRLPSTPFPMFPPQLTVRAKFEKDDNSGYKRFLDIDPAILYMQRNGHTDISSSSASTESGDDPHADGKHKIINKIQTTGEPQAIGGPKIGGDHQTGSDPQTGCDPQTGGDLQIADEPQSAGEPQAPGEPETGDEYQTANQPEASSQQREEIQDEN